MVNNELDPNDIEVLKNEYQKLADNWRHFNTIIWGLPSVAVVIFTGILVAAYSDDLVGLPRVISLSIGSIFLFAVTVEVVKKRHDLNIIALAQKTLLKRLQVDINKKKTLPEVIDFPIGLNEDNKEFYKVHPEIKKFRDYDDPVFEFFYRSYAKQFLTGAILAAAITMAILAELEFFWYLVTYIDMESAYIITITIGIIAIVAPCIAYGINITMERRERKKLGNK